MQIVQPKEARKGQRRCIKACENALKWPWMSLDIPLTLKWQWMTKAQCEMNRAEDDEMNVRRRLQRPENGYTWPKSGYEGDEWLQRWPKNHSMRHVKAREWVSRFRISCTSEPPISTSITQTSTRKLTPWCAMSPWSMPCLCRRST
jgi:hypothetical protein